jgi:hypothetical protein
MVNCTCNSPAEIQKPTHWNQIGASLTAPAASFIAQQYSSLTFVSLRVRSGKENFGARIINIISFYFTS